MKRFTSFNGNIGRSADGIGLRLMLEHPQNHGSFTRQVLAGASPYVA